MDVHTRSTSPGLRRSLSLLGLSVAQQCAQMVEHITERAYSGVGAIAKQTRHAQSMAEAIVAEARSMHGEVEGKMAELKQRVEVNASTTANVLASRIE